MKRHVLLYSLLLMCSILCAQQTLLLSEKRIVDGIQETIPTRDIEDTEDGIKVTYELKGVSLQKDPLFKGAYFVRIDGFGTNSIPSEPETLFRWDSFVIPSGADVKVIVTDSAYIDVPLELAPARPPLVASDTSSGYGKIKAIGSYDGFFPRSIVSDIKHLNYNGIPLLDVCFNPVQYDANHKKLRIYTKITYELKYGILSKKEVDANTITYDSFIQNTTLNGAFVKHPGRKNYRINSHSGYNYNSNFVIISVPKYSEAVNRFAEWKKIMGYQVTVLMDNSWTVAKVKQQIPSIIAQDKYIVIIGDHQDVPAEYVDVSNDYVDCHFYSDYHYAIEGFGDTEIPTSYLGRISVSTVSEANSVINKIIKYEKNPVADASFYNTMLTCAYYQDGEDKDTANNTIPADGYEDRRFVLTTERIRDYLLNKEKTVNRIYLKTIGCTPTYWNNTKFADGSLMPASLTNGSFTWGGSQSDVVNQINNGTFCVMYNGHGISAGWSNGGQMFCFLTNTSLSNGTKLPIVLSFSCNTGQFADVGVCFAERFLRANNGGCVGMVAATTKSYSGYNDALAEGFFDTLWPSPGLIPTFPNKTTSNYPYNYSPETRVGKVLVQAMRKAHQTWHREFYDYMFYEYFGDPSMWLFTEQPTSFENVTITRTSDLVRVNMPYVQGSLLSFYDKSTGEVVSYFDYNDPINGAYVTGNADSIIVCISGPNKIPLIDDPTQNYYIQNETVTGPRTIQSEIIKVGHHVTDMKSQGDVSISGGGTVTLIGNEVILDAGTTIGIGTEVEIRNP